MDTEKEENSIESSDEGIKTEEVMPAEVQLEVKREERTESSETWPSKISIWKEKARVFIKECIRVLRITKKPDKTEFSTIVKVSGIGILVIGIIGFLVFLIKELLF